jgi:PKD repeat protein
MNKIRTMKNSCLVIYFLYSISFSVIGQIESAPCAFDRLTNNTSINNSEVIIRNGIKSLPKNHDIKVIPVVVHIFHEGGTENISDAQIQSQITVLNEDFGKLLGSNGDGNGVDTEVRFCLAKIDPNGNCTNGIVRVKSSLTNHKTYERPLLKLVSFWDNTKYLNIYIVKSIPGGTLGYSSFPGGPPDEDGLVVRHNYFGKTGTAASSLGRTGTHEVGHWLGLYHTFNNSCGTDICNDGDYVCDTPPVLTANFSCNPINSCSNDNPDLQDQIENYMDYTPEACSNMFTAGQSDRILSSLINLRSLIWTNANLIATGCDENYVAPPTCGVVANFVSLNPEICINNTVSFLDVSLNNPTNWQWTFTGGSPSTSNLQNPQVSYSGLGNYDVKLVVTDGIISDSITLNNYVSVTNPGIGIPLPYQENFESNIFPPSGITINNPDGGIAWELDSNASVSPTHSVSLDNLNSTNYGTIDEIILPFLDLSSNLLTPYMKFKWAYAKSVSLYSDEMIVQLSVDCGATWNQIYYRSNNNLVTGPTQTTPFIPDATQWKQATINLNSYASSSYVLIKIMNVTDGGNFLYIDDINIGDVTLSVDENEVLSNFNVYPNPSNGIFTIQHSNSLNSSEELELYSLEGKLLQGFQINGDQTKVNVGHLPKGTYFLQSKEFGFFKKIVIN